jgi:threonine dehydrogenase-like Zn-dependent dehydrogenase
MWNDERRTETVLALLSELSLENLITHRIPFDDIASAYEKIDSNPDDIVQYSVTY